MPRRPRAVPLTWMAAALGLLLTGVVPARAAETHLVLVGGGDRSAEAMRRFVEWAGGGQAKVLVVLWATSVPEESLQGLADDLTAAGAKTIEAAPLAPVVGAAREKLLAQIAWASGVFFSGGDQARVMKVLEDETLLQALRARYREGVVFGGTSAGTAIMSDPMITGEGDFTVIDAAKVEVKPGLGLLPGVIVDQHFVKRQRENRLFGLILARPELLGLGINEDTAALVTADRLVEVVGAGPVMAVDGRAGHGQLLLTVLQPGERFDLQQRQRP